MASTTNRLPKLEASIANASRFSSADHQLSTQRTRGTKQVDASISVRFSPCLASPSLYHSRSRCLILFSLTCRSSARKMLTLFNPQLRAMTIPKLHSASTVACALLSVGSFSPTTSAHSVTLLGSMVVPLSCSVPPFSTSFCFCLVSIPTPQSTGGGGD